MKVFCVIYLAALVGCATPPPVQVEAYPPMHPPPPVLSAEENQAIDIARRTVAARETWAKEANYEVRRRASGWLVIATRNYSPPRPSTKTQRLIVIDENGKVTDYLTGE